MIGAFEVNTWVAFFAASGVILSASYALWLYRRIIFGALTKDTLRSMLDLNWREAAVLFPLVVLIIFFGFYPAPILDTSAASINALVAQVSHALAAAPAVVAH